MTDSQKEWLQIVDKVRKRVLDIDTYNEIGETDAYELQSLMDALKTARAIEKDVLEQVNAVPDFDAHVDAVIAAEAAVKGILEEKPPPSVEEILGNIRETGRCFFLVLNNVSGQEIVCRDERRDLLHGKDFNRNSIHAALVHAAGEFARFHTDTTFAAWWKERMG